MHGCSPPAAVDALRACRPAVIPIIYVDECRAASLLALPFLPSCAATVGRHVALNVACCVSPRCAAALLLRIFGYLSPKDLLTCAMVSRRFKGLAESPLLWRQLFFADFHARTDEAWPAQLHIARPKELYRQRCVAVTRARACVCACASVAATPPTPARRDGGLSELRLLVCSRISGSVSAPRSPSHTVYPVPCVCMSRDRHATWCRMSSRQDRMKVERRHIDRTAASAASTVAGCVTVTPRPSHCVCGR